MSLPDWLVADLGSHRNTYSPIWRGYLSDHLPMTAMALWQQGVPREEIRAWMARYQKQLEPISHVPEIDDWQDGAGDLRAYGALLAFFDKEIERLGEEGVVQRYLPELISGWVADAFHPLIRLGYARRFSCSGEVSAGLAYMAARGQNEHLDAMARAAIAGPITWPQSSPIPGRTFDERARHYISNGDAVVHVPDDAARAYALEVLDILNATHNFFALHLVTATHAFLVVTEGIDDIGVNLLAAGLIAGYAAAGAPGFVRDVAPQPFHTDFEHDIKLAFAVVELAERLGNPAYAASARVFGRPPVDIGKADR